VNSWITPSFSVFRFVSPQTGNTYSPAISQKGKIYKDLFQGISSKDTEWSAPLFLSYLKFSISRQDNAAFHLHVIQLNAHFPSLYLCLGWNVDAASVINFFVSLGGGGSAAYNYMPLGLVGRTIIGRRMTVAFY